MQRKVYQCPVCGSMPGSRIHQGGFSRGAEDQPHGIFEKPGEILDLTQVEVNGQTRWQYFPTWRAGQTSGWWQGRKFVSRQ